MKVIRSLLLLSLFGWGMVFAQNTSAVINASSCEKPEYPSASKRLEEEGTVQLKFLVGSDGRVIESQVEKSSGFRRLDEAARQGLTKCIFKPAIKDGVSVQSHASMKYTWQLAPWSSCSGQEISKWNSCLGTFQSSSGGVTVVEFVNGVPAGRGIEYDSSGNVIKSGDFSKGILVNSRPLNKDFYPFNSKLTTTKPTTCEGDLANWNDCLGSLNFHDGSSYTGAFKNGQRDGLGTFTLENRSKYVGSWKEDKRNGEGTYFASNGYVIYEGIWSDDKFVRSATVLQASLPSVMPSNVERDRLAAEVDAERKKRQELEEKLKVVQQPIQTNQQPVSSGMERRVALVIGNATYKFNPLRNPVNDSSDMARSLRSVGFDVIEANNTTLAQMREVTRRFADKLGNSDVGLVYYSGHGVEVKGRNYLIPVNADIKREYEVVDQAFDASQFLEMMDNIRGPNNKRVNILIVDACRNNELQRSWRSTNNGLARMDAPGGTFISFATAPGRVAADGVGRNSPYTKHLLQALKQPNVPIEQVFKVVRRNVMEETKGEQIPWENSSLVGDFYFTVQR